MTDNLTETEQELCKKAEPQKEHEWLMQLVGSWTYEAECLMGPGQPPLKSQGTENVRSLGGLWIVGEGQSQMPDGEPATMLITLGYDPAEKRYVGTWVGSMMTHMWIYNGEMDTTGKILTLNAEGPDFTTPGKTAKYQDIIEIKDSTHRILKSRALGEDGQWHEFMQAHYRKQA